jgi:hypothetical protein
MDLSWAAGVGSGSGVEMTAVVETLMQAMATPVSVAVPVSDLDLHSGVAAAASRLLPLQLTVAVMAYCWYCWYCCCFDIDLDLSPDCRAAVPHYHYLYCCL